MRKRELVTLLKLSSCCHVAVSVFVSLSPGVVDLSAVCGCGISLLSYSFTFCFNI